MSSASPRWALVVDRPPPVATVSAYARIERGEANPTWTTVTQMAARGVSLSELGAAVEKSRGR